MKDLRRKFQGASAALIVLGLVQGATCLAYVPNEDQCVDLKQVVVMKPADESFFTKDNATRYLPTNMSPGTDQGAFITQFQNGLGQKVTDSIVQGDAFKHSSVGKFSTNVENATKTSMVITDPGTNTVTQKINFSLQAIQRTAKMAYEGYVNSTITYKVDLNTMDLVISKPLNKTTTLSLTNTSPMGQISPAGMLTLTHDF